MKYNYNNLTLILGSYNCNKNCPYCIAKNNMKFDNNNDRIDNLDYILQDLIESNIYFNKFVLSGNGEPSLYDIETLKRIKEILIKNRNLFGSLRVHSSGNIFFEEDKFNIFNDELLKPEFEILRVSLDYDIDSSILGYNGNYVETDCFKRANCIKCDIAFTDYLEINNLGERIKELLMNNPQIKKIRFKKLMVGDNNFTKQAKWVVDHTISDEVICELMNSLKKIDESVIVYDKVGNYEFDYVINCGELQDYNYNKLKVSDLVKRRKVNE